MKKIFLIISRVFKTFNWYICLNWRDLKCQPFLDKRWTPVEPRMVFYFMFAPLKSWLLFEYALSMLSSSRMDELFVSSHLCCYCLSICLIGGISLILFCFNFCKLINARHSNDLSLSFCFLTLTHCLRNNTFNDLIRCLLIKVVK